jgi:hypothetical protein
MTKIDEPRCHVCGWAERSTNKVEFDQRPEPVMGRDEDEETTVQVGWSTVICTACRDYRAQQRRYKQSVAA